MKIKDLKLANYIDAHTIETKLDELESCLSVEFINWELDPDVYREAISMIRDIRNELDSIKERND